ncbi:MAG: Rieske 2Fe-2S domain-containing protein [Gemmatimonadetes bacterium]|nr:Rieske 2Fe-2S domain-containing protein [Gemmatimonadota bacterium]
MSDCGGDCRSSRRDFLVRATGALAAALATLPLTSREAAALPMALGSALRRRGATVNYAIPASDSATIDRDNEVILVRWKGAAYAFALSCPHQNTALRWQEADAVFQCPKHKSRYQPDGTFLNGRATRNMDRFAIAHAGHELAVDVDKLYESDKQADLWKAATVPV